MTEPAMSTNQDSIRFEMTRSLQDRVRQLESRLEALDRRRRQRLLIIGLGVSVFAHAIILLYMSGMFRPGPPAGITTSETFELAILNEQELSRFNETLLRDLVDSPPVPNLTMDDPNPLQDLEVTTPELVLNAESQQVSTLAETSGGEGVATLSSGGGGASFFGISSRGNRFAYIMDMSGSMAQGTRWDVAQAELVRSVSALPDFTSFYVVLFSNEPLSPPRQAGWTRAGLNATRQLESWLRTVGPTGGTLPAPAFLQVFALEQRPEVIFFMTDGEIPQDTPDIVATLNERGQRVVVNTISFGDPAGQATLKKLAEQTGGVYRHVPTMP